MAGVRPPSLTAILYSLVVFTFTIAGTPPLIIKQGPREQFYRTGSSYEIPCEAQGDPSPRYTWLVNGDVPVDDPDGTFSIVSVNSDGYYQCFATNDYGTAVSDITHLRMASLTGIHVSMTPLEYRGLAYDSMMVECGSMGSVPDGTFVWEITSDDLDGESWPVVPSSRINQDDDGNLYIAYLTADDAKNGQTYTCSVFNSYLDNSAVRRRATILVDPPTSTADRPPIRMFSSPPTQTVTKGSRLRLRCFFSGKPLPTIEWRRIGGDLPAGRSQLLSLGTELAIDDIRGADGGQYECEGVNDAGQESHVFTVTVEAAPTFKSDGQPTAEEVEEGGNVTFYCDTDAIPPATKQWYINGEPISANSLRSRLSIRASGTKLKVTGACSDCHQSDVMAVQCNASNIHGYAFASGYLAITSGSSASQTPSYYLNCWVAMVILTSFLLGTS